MTPPEASGPQREPTPRPRDVVRHVISCHPCSDSVESIKSRDELLQHLASPRQDPALIDNVLGQTARVGRHELGTLLYEMGRASLALVPHVRRAIQLYEAPSTLQDAHVRAQSLACRASAASSVIAIPAGVAEDPVCAARLGVNLSLVLQQLEGRSVRSLLLHGCGLVETRDYRAASIVLEEATSHSRTRLESAMSRMNLTLALLLAEEFETAAVKARAFVADQPEEPMLWFNLANASAALGRKDDFEKACEGFRESFAASPRDTSWWSSFILNEVDELSNWVGMTPSETITILGADSLGAAQ